MSKELTDQRTSQTVGTRELKFRDRIGIGIWTSTKNGLLWLLSFVQSVLLEPLFTNRFQWNLIFRKTH